MAYSATVFSVMIASPGDVLEERNLVRDVIHEWNDLNATATSCVLMPVAWESHSRPEMGARAQEVINEQVLDNCDLLVGVFWTRLGTPTGEFASGTVEEIRRHVDAGKPAMVYFSTAPVAPQSIDFAQFEALKQFKDWCKTVGLIENYDNLSQFREKFRRHIALTVRDNKYLKTLRRSAGGPETVVSIGALPPTQAKPLLSPEALRLLAEATHDRSGTIIYARYLSGQALQTNGINFTDSGDRRSIARWEAALEELVGLGFIKDIGSKRNEVFQVTDAGYRFIEKLDTAGAA